MTAVFELHTDRLRLRPMVVDDAPAFFALDSHPEVYRNTGEPPPGSVAQVEARIRDYPDYADRGYGRLACVLRETGEMIGFCGLKKLPELGGAVDLGYRLAPAHWGRGLATEAGHEVLRFGFDVLGLARVIGLVLPSNRRSVRVLEKLGMRREGEIEVYGELAEQYAMTPADLRPRPRR